MRLIDLDTVYESACAGCTRHGDASGECYNDEPCERLIFAFTTAETVEAAPVVHGRWEDVKETSLYVPDMKYTVTHTAETCSACKVRIGFIGSKPYLYDNICPDCGAKMEKEE